MEILLTSHGSFCESLLESYQMIVGDNSKIHTCSLTDTGIEDFRTRLNQVLDSKMHAAEEILIFCDLKGGSPYNESLLYSLKSTKNIQIITGMNLPMLIETGVLLSQTGNLEELTDKAIETGINGIEKLEDNVIEDDDLF